MTKKCVIPNLFRNLGLGNNNKLIPFYQRSISSFLGFYSELPTPN